MENGACPVLSNVCDEDENDCESNNEPQIPNVPSLPKPGERQPLLMTSSDVQNAPSKSSSTNNTVPEYADQPRKEITTKLCKNIAKLMGETDEVYQLDQARKDLKCHPKSMKTFWYGCR